MGANPRLKTYKLVGGPLGDTDASVLTAPIDADIPDGICVPPPRLQVEIAGEVVINYHGKPVQQVKQGVWLVYNLFVSGRNGANPNYSDSYRYVYYGVSESKLNDGDSTFAIYNFDKDR